MKYKISEQLNIAKQLGKNMLMRSRLLKMLRNKIASGRTTGALDVEKAYQHSLSIFQQYQQGLSDAGLPSDYFKGKLVLEIGPGANLGVQLNFIAHGAAQAYALDRFEDIQSTEKESELYEKILAELSNEQQQLGHAVYATENGLPVFKGDKIQYLGKCSLERAVKQFTDEAGDLTMRFDMVVSHLALEHVANLNRGIYSVARLLKPGGICIFICNLKSLGGVYNHEKEPLRLLYYSEKLWQGMFSKRGGSNRVRAYGYKKRLEVNNFEILNFNVLEAMPIPELKKIKRHFANHYSSLTKEELSILKFRIVARLKSKNDMNPHSTNGYFF